MHDAVMFGNSCHLNVWSMFVLLGYYEHHKYCIQCCQSFN